MASRDTTPLPPPRPPSMDFGAFDVATPRKPARRSRFGGALPWLLALAAAGAAWGAIARLGHVDRRAQRAIAAARDEAAEHRAARFAAEAEVHRLQAENQRLATQVSAVRAVVGAPDAGAAPGGAVTR